jgi:hypothetical protein
MNARKTPGGKKKNTKKKVMDQRPADARTLWSCRCDAQGVKLTSGKIASANFHDPIEWSDQPAVCYIVKTNLSIYFHCIFLLYPVARVRSIRNNRSKCESVRTNHIFFITYSHIRYIELSLRSVQETHLKHPIVWLVQACLPHTHLSEFYLGFTSSHLWHVHITCESAWATDLNQHTYRVDLESQER